MLAILLLTTLAPKLPAQLGYDHTAFLNGYGSDSTIWLQSYAELQMSPGGYLSQRVYLATTAYPNVSKYLRYGDQVTSINSYLLGAGGQNVMVGHSLGSLVSRGVYIDDPGTRPRISAIVALTPPHQGTPLADNYVLLRNYLKDMQRRIQDAVSGFNVASIIYDLIFVRVVWHPINGLGPALFGAILYVVNGTSIDLSNIDQFGGAPALADLSPSAASISHLNTHYEDGSIPRANIIGSIPFRNAGLRLMKSMDDDDSHFDHMVTLRNFAQEFFSTCKWAGYVIVVTWTSGRRCAYARKTLGRLDERWARYVNGWDANGRARYVPFDGVVPNDHSIYPTQTALAYQGVANLINHINVYKRSAGLEQAANGMLAVGMLPAGGGPPPSFTVSISGTSTPVIGCPDYWLAGATGGVAPYTYAWTVDGQYYDTGGGDELGYTATSSNQVTMTVTATDANGHSGSHTLMASPMSGNCM